MDGKPIKLVVSQTIFPLISQSQAPLPFLSLSCKEPKSKSSGQLLASVCASCAVLVGFLP